MHAFVAGGAGFIGTHIVERLVRMPKIKSVKVYDNFSSRKLSDLSSWRGRVNVTFGEISDLQSLREAMKGHDVVFHFASNPDISKAATDPTIDFWQGTHLTQNIAEAARLTGVRQVLYASGSGVYGDHGHVCIHEDFRPQLPVSTYGASKLAGEAILCAYAHMFGLQTWVFRFGNVVGPGQTHGVLFDFIKKLRADPRHLPILGDGGQSKPYIHVEDVVDAVWLAWQNTNEPFNYFNVSTDDTVDVSHVAKLAADSLGLVGVSFEYSGGTKGWPGDVPIVRLDSSKLKRLGWRANRNSRQALEDAARALAHEHAAT